MSKTVGELKDGVAGILTGTNLDNVTNLEIAFERGLRMFLQKASIPEASTSQAVTLYDGVYNYLPPTTIFGGALRDFRPIGVNRTTYDQVYRQPIEAFDMTKVYLPNGVALTFETENGINLMRVASTRTIPRINLDSMNSTSGWVAAGSASGLVVDNSFYYTASASLRFNLTGASSGTLTKTLTNSLDLTAYQGVGVVFLALEIPATLLTSLQLKIGSSAAAYYSLSVTQGFLGAWTSGDFIITAFDLSQASTTGSPVITAMNYIQMTFAHSTTLTNTRVGGLWISLPTPYKMIFETTAVFQNSVTGIVSNSIGSISDLILLGESAYNIYEQECAVTVGLQQGGSLASGVLYNINSILNGARAKNGTVIQLGLYDLYKAANPAEEIRAIGSYYE